MSFESKNVRDSAYKGEEKKRESRTGLLEGACSEEGGGVAAIDLSAGTKKLLGDVEVVLDDGQVERLHVQLRGLEVGLCGWRLREGKETALCTFSLINFSTLATSQFQTASWSSRFQPEATA